MTVAYKQNRITRAQDVRDRAEAARSQARTLASRTKQLRGQFEQATAPVSAAELLQYSPHARLLARLETMPVIEQAKGIIMAQVHCAGDEAFNRLRGASQRSNVPVRELATRIVSNAAPQATNPPRVPMA